MKKNKKIWLGLLPGLLTLLLDRLTKKALFGRNRMLLPGVIRITSARNTGMALGLMPNSAWGCASGCCGGCGCPGWRRQAFP